MTIEKLKNKLDDHFGQPMRQPGKKGDGIRIYPRFKCSQKTEHISLKHKGIELKYLNKRLKDYGINQENNKIELILHRLGHKLNDMAHLLYDATPKQIEEYYDKKYMNNNQPKYN